MRIGHNTARLWTRLTSTFPEAALLQESVPTDGLVPPSTRGR
jgi:hypothetical protein